MDFSYLLYIPSVVERCAIEECPQGAFVGKNCECFCQGPPKDPVQRCTRNPKSIDLTVENI
ncbi:hypothetical protein DPMN_150278 [Dreissena polymorpha]|uniref:Uncharacterized protein n=1 Tax=Dreissena polymorpha TaxID=45954 RepID=A0A9D4FFG5_DREPO|nr:hypothetical protein DPMN_150278 [Dreissena polymorpha]